MNRLLAAVAVAGVALACAYTAAGRRARMAPETSDAFPLRETPVAFSPHPVPGITSKAQLREVLTSVRPYFVRRNLATKVPSALVIHAAKLWGPAAVFPSINHNNAAVAALGGHELFDILLSHRAFAHHSQYESQGLLFRSPYGVRVACSTDGAHGGGDTATHFGKIVQVCGEHALPASRPVLTADGHEAVLADIIRDDAARVAAGCELEFVIPGLCRYAMSDRPWVNRFGQKVTFDVLADALVSMDAGGGTCEGISRLYAMATLARVADESGVVSVGKRDELRAALRRVSQRLSETQQPDGAWGWNWAATATLTDTRLPLPYRNAFVGQVLVTGHHLEWMALCPPDCRPPAETIQAAGLFLLRSWLKVRDELAHDWHNYSLITHAARGLWLLAGAPDLTEFQGGTEGRPVGELPSLPDSGWRR